MEQAIKTEKVLEKVLITGGAGYIGCVLTEHLLNLGYQVTVLDNLYYNQRTLFNFCADKSFDFIFGDARDEELLQKILPGFDVIIPLAAIVGAPASDQRKNDAQTINYDAVVMINNLKQSHQKLIYPTTNSGYGTKSSEIFCTEETPLEPISLYGNTKANAEKKLLREGNVITLRLATVFGASQRMRTDLLVNDFVRHAIFDRYIVLFEKHFKRNYIHIKDVARCFDHCIKNYELMKDNAYNAGLEDANLSKEELALKIKEFLPKLIIISEEIASDPDKRNYIVSNQKLYATDFKPKYSIGFGIKELVKAYGILRDNPSKNV